MFGGRHPGQRVPFVFAKVESKDLSAYLRDDPKGPAWGSVLDNYDARTPWHFDEHESLLKADWHTLAPGAKEVFQPRRAAVVKMPQAPPRIYAFAKAFRDQNIPVWNSIAHSLRALKMEPSEDVGSLADIFLHALQERLHFGTVEVQVGRGNQITLPSHKDGASSLLHLSLTLGGCRTLRMGRYTRRHSAPKDLPNFAANRHLPSKTRDRLRRERDRKEENVWDSNCWRDGNIVDSEMLLGSTYISSPCCFEHAVRYGKCSFDDPVIALQCRFAMLDGEVAHRINMLQDESMRQVSGVVASSLKAAVDKGELQMPSVGQVKLARLQLAAQNMHSPASQLSTARGSSRRLRGFQKNK